MVQMIVVGATVNAVEKVTSNVDTPLPMASAPYRPTPGTGVGLRFPALIMSSEIETEAE